MTQYANATPVITGAPDYWDELTHLWKQLAKRYGWNDAQQQKARKVLIVAILLVATDFSFGSFVAAQIVTRAAVGCVCYLGFSDVLPRHIALSEAQRFA